MRGDARGFVALLLTAGCGKARSAPCQRHRAPLAPDIPPKGMGEHPLRVKSASPARRLSAAPPLRGSEYDRDLPGRLSGHIDLVDPQLQAIPAGDLGRREGERNNRSVCHRLPRRDRAEDHAVRIDINAAAIQPGDCLNILCGPVPRILGHKRYGDVQTTRRRLRRRAISVNAYGSGPGLRRPGPCDDARDQGAEDYQRREYSDLASHTVIKYIGHI